MEPKRVLDDLQVNVKIKIAALWVSAELLYLYGDVIGFWSPGTIQRMMEGDMVVLKVTPLVLLGIAVVMSIPPIMIALSLWFRPVVSRALNVIFGLAEAALMAYTMIDAWKYGMYFYVYLGVVEVIVTLLIVWLALTWPKHVRD